MAPAKETRTCASPWLRWVQHRAEGGGVQVPVSPPPHVTAWDEAVGSKQIFTSSHLHHQRRSLVLGLSLGIRHLTVQSRDLTIFASAEQVLLLMPLHFRGRQSPEHGHKKLWQPAETS